MSRKKRKLEKQKKQNSPAMKAKLAKKRYYASDAARDKWESKKEKKYQSQINKRMSQGISSNCPLQSWEQPNSERCKGCEIKKCSFNNQ